MKILSLRSFRKNFIAFALTTTALNGQAAIIDFDTYFTDTSTSLSWLDVTATVNRSFNDISTQFGVGGEFEGWRYATGLEFNALLSSWTGIPAVIANRTITTGTSPSVDGLVTLFGSTLDNLWVERFGQTWDSRNGYAEGEGIDFTLGLLADPFETDASQRKVAAIWDNERNGTATDFYNIDHRQLRVTSSASDIGSFLVRGAIANNSGGSNGSSTGGTGGNNPVAVDEPKNYFLFVMGLVGLVFCRRRKHA